MVQKTSAGSRGRGRPPKFDRDAVIAAAIEAFWDKGLDATSLPDLEAATGVDRSTLYNSFGGKSGLYESATAQYLAQAETWLFAPLLEGTDDGIADVVEFLDRLGRGLTSGEHRPGCLIVNDMAVGPDKRPSERYRDLLERGLRSALGRSVDGPTAAVDGRARLLAASVIGANLMSRAGADADELSLLVGAMVAQVESWREPAPA